MNAEKDYVSDFVNTIKDSMTIIESELGRLSTQLLLLDKKLNTKGKISLGFAVLALSASSAFDTNRLLKTFQSALVGELDKEDLSDNMRLKLKTAVINITSLIGGYSVLDMAHRFLLTTSTPEENENE